MEIVRIRKLGTDWNGQFGEKIVRSFRYVTPALDYFLKVDWARVFDSLTLFISQFESFVDVDKVICPT